jgi:hypothetical protein
MNWQPIESAPKDNKRPLYLAKFNEIGKLIDLDFDGGWEYWESYGGLRHVNGWTWVSANGLEEPTHWAYQDSDAPPATAPSPPYLTPPEPENAAVPVCDQCGLRLAPVMGYVCGRQDCKIFMKATC